mgnify:FL=1
MEFNEVVRNTIWTKRGATERSRLMRVIFPEGLNFSAKLQRKNSELIFRHAIISVYLEF